jgi:hypothetical protein
MVFTFAVCSFTMQQLLNLQKAPIMATLARLGINRNISRDIVFGSALYGGLGLLNLFVEQGIAQLQLLLRHLRAGTSQGSLLLIGLSWWHLVAGFSSSLWENTSAKICYVEHSWYSSLRDFLVYAHGTIYIPPADFLHWHHLRGHDKNIMAIVSSLDSVTRVDLKAFNRCRLFLGVMFLSEITDADGLTLSRDAWTGDRRRFSYLLWPYQLKPGTKSWQFWRRLLARPFLESVPKKATPKTKDLFLLQPLGPWQPGLDWIFGKWAYHYSPSTGLIYHATPIHYTVHQRQRRSHHRSQFVSAHLYATIRSLPLDCIPVNELSSSTVLLAFRGMNSSHLQPPTTTAPVFFYAYIQTLPLWDRQVLQHVDIPDSAALISYLLSDGGDADELGSFGALLATDDIFFVKLLGST